MAEESPNILVVDDSEAICSALRDLLTMNDYKVRTAPSGERALQIMESGKIDLIVTDLKMGGMSGLDLLKAVKQKHTSLPVIILTGFGDMDSVIEAMRAGVSDYLKKPFSVNEVLEVVRRELKKATFVAPLATASITNGAAEAGEKPPRLYLFSPQDLATVEKTLSELRAQVTAESVLLLEEAGYIISSKGTFGESELPSLTSLIVSGRTATAQLARMLGEEQAFALNYLEGQRLNVYTAGLGKGLFLVLMVPNFVKQGAVWLYARKAASEIERVAERALDRTFKAKKTGPLGPSRQELRHELSDQTENVFGHELEETPAPSGPIQTLTFEEAMRQGLVGDMVDMMARESRTPEPAAPALQKSIPPEALQPEGPVETMSFEDAMRLGLMGDLGSGLGPATTPSQPAPQKTPEEPVAPEPSTPAVLEPVKTFSFAEAMRQGLLSGLGRDLAPPAPQKTPATPGAPAAATGRPETSRDQAGAPKPAESPPKTSDTSPEKPPDSGDNAEFLTFEEMLERGLLGPINPPGRS